LSTGQVFHTAKWVEDEILGIWTAAPMVEVNLKAKDGLWQPISMKIDTGAAMSFLPASWCKALGFKLRSGTPLTLGAANGHQIKTYVHEVDIKVGTKTIEKVHIAFFANARKETEPLFGIMDAFDKFQLTLGGKTLDSYFMQETEDVQLV
jgi:predicted aspartyl protease